MKNIKFLQEPGYMYDLFFLFSLYFNKDYYMSNYINFNKAAEDTEYLNKVLSDFGPMPEELLPFFYIKDNVKCFMTQYYYEAHAKNLAGTYDVSVVQAEIADFDRVTENLIRFYFEGITDEALAECKTSLSAVGKLIKNSSYSAEVKNSLFSFFLEPVLVIQKLSYELMTKRIQLEQHYEKNYRQILKLQSGIDIEGTIEKLSEVKNQKCDLSKFDTALVSVCLLNKHSIKIYYLPGKVLLLLGADYEDYADYLKNQKELPELDAFGTALSEANRIEILDLILQKGEITIKDVEQALDFTGTNAYYHLSLMIKANMIKTRNRGRTVLYSINNGYFDSIINVLGKYRV